MFRVFMKSREINIIENVNMFIYAFKKIPFLGRFISENLYGERTAKVIFSYIVALVKIFFAFFKKLAYIFFPIMLPGLFISEKTGTDASIIGFQIFFFLSFLGGTLIENILTINKSKDFKNIGIMRLNAKKYYLSNMIFYYIETIICFIFPLMLLRFSFVEAILIALALISFRIISQAIYLKLIDKKAINLSNNLTYATLIMILPLILAYGLAFLNVTFNFKEFLLDLRILIVILIFGVISFIYLLKFNKYKEVFRKVVSKGEIKEVNEILIESQFAEVKVDKLKLNESEKDKEESIKKKRYDYLNYKFFKRYNRIFLKPIKIRLIAIGIALITAIISTFFSDEFKKAIPWLLLNSTGVLIFLFYVISTGEKSAKAFFYNCDSAMLRYKFYREPKDILENFTCRVKMVTLLNIIPAIAIILSYIILLIIAEGNILEFIPVFISMITLSVFFVIHHLFLYYIIQPYTAQLTVKSPVYRVISGVVWFLCYFALQMESASIAFTVGIIIVTVIYTALALVAIYKYAPRNFKLK